MSAVALSLTGITKRYRNTTVLGPLSLELEKGRIYGLIGENGAGKSTLIRIIMGLSKQTDGDIELFGRSGEGDLTLARANVGYVPDSSASYPLLSAYDNLKARCLEWGIDQNQIPRLLDTVGLAQVGTKKSSQLFPWNEKATGPCRRAAGRTTNARSRRADKRARPPWNNGDEKSNQAT